jgi:hypothetical protein
MLFRQAGGGAEVRRNYLLRDSEKSYTVGKADNANRIRFLLALLVYVHACSSTGC